jgi:phosphoglycolate phosphatase-like HAD superfamily hydrolase
MMALRAMIFDMDGTLANTLPVCIEAFQMTFEKYLGTVWTDEQVEATFGINEEGIFKTNVPEHHVEAVKDFIGFYKDLHYKTNGLFPGMEDALSMLKARGLKLGIVTGKGKGSAEISVNEFGLGQYFEDIETGSPDVPDKHVGIQRLLNKWGIAAEEAAYVGDTVYDMETSASLGLVAIGAAWADTATVQQGNHADCIFTSVPEFIEWVDRAVPA